MTTNTEQVRDKLIAGVNAVFAKYGRSSLIEDAGSPQRVRVIMRELATLLDATAVSLAFHAGMDGDEFNPALVETVEDDFAYHCDRVMIERVNLPTHAEYVREHSTIGA